MIKILFDISVLGTGFRDEHNKIGVYRVCEETLRVLLQEKDFVVYPYTSQRNIDDCLAYLNENYPFLLDNFVRVKKNKIISIIKNIFIKKYDYCFSPYFAIPKEFRINIWLKKVLIIHDLIQVKFPEWVHPEDTKLYQKLLSTISNDTTILCVSNCTKNDFIKYKPYVRDIRILPLGYDNRYYNSQLSTDKLKKVLEKYNIFNKKYFFSISSMNPRKNFSHIVKSYIKFIEKYNIDNILLVLSGPVGWGDLWKGIDLNKYKDKIIFTGFVPEDDLPYLYAGAIASIYMSLYEGFGLPPLESLACGTPVIVSNCGSIPEVVGDAGILLPPSDEILLIETYYNFLINKEIRKNILQLARPVLEKYTWNNFRKEILKVFK